MKPAHRILALACTMSSSLAMASTLNSAQLGINPNFSGGTGPVNETVAHTGVVELNSGLVTGGASSTGHGFAYADYGVIKLSGDSAGSLNAVTRGIFRDDLTFNVAGVASGTLAQVMFSLQIGGTLTAASAGIGEAGWQLQADLGGGAFDINRSASFFSDSGIFAKHGYTGDPFGTYSATVTVQLGFVAPLDVELSASAQSAFDGDHVSAPASFDLAHSLYWGGVSAIVVDGNDVTAQASVTSGSGTPYMGSLAPAPVPLPPALLTCLGGVAVVGRRRRLT